MFGPSVLPGNIPLGLTGGAPITSLPGLPDGLALDRLSSLGGTQSLAGLAAPSSLNGLLEQQLAQSGQLLQLMTLLLSLMQNKTTGQTGSAGDSSAANGAAPVNCLYKGSCRKFKVQALNGLASAAGPVTDDVKMRPGGRQCCEVSHRWWRRLGQIALIVQMQVSANP